MLRIEYWSWQPTAMIDGLSNATHCYSFNVNIKLNKYGIYTFLLSLILLNYIFFIHVHEVLNILFLHNSNSRVGGKNKNMNQQEQFYFHSSFGKIWVGRSRKSEKWKMLALWYC